MNREHAIRVITELKNIATVSRRFRDSLIQHELTTWSVSTNENRVALFSTTRRVSEADGGKQDVYDHHVNFTRVSASPALR